MALKTRAVYLTRPEEAKAFNKAFVDAARSLQERLRAQYVKSKNVQHFHHGSRQLTFHEGKPEETSMKSHSVEMVTKFQEIVDGDLSIISRSIDEITSGLHAQFARSIYALMSETCEKTGNTVDAKSKASLAEAFEEMLSKVEFIADRDEKVSLPEIHLPAQKAEIMLQELESQPGEFQEKIESIKQRKIAEAILRERERKARFVKYGE